MPSPALSRVRFGAFELDLSTGELRSIEAPDRDNKVLLREQVFQVLRMLLEHEGKIVTREEMKSRLWANDTVVDFDQSINATIKTLRRALGDSADAPQYIETLARRGYRLMVATEYLESDPGTALEKDRGQRTQSAVEMSEDPARVQQQAKPHGWTAAVVLASVVILAGAVYISWRHFRPTALPGKIMLAVLPFKNLTGDPSKEYVADGLTEQTISQLGRLNPEQLGVIARTSIMGYKNKDTRLDQIGRDLSVQYVLENSLRGNGDHLRLTAQLIQVKDQTHIWSQDYDYAAKDVLNVEDEVARSVAHQIQVRLTSQQQADLTRPRAVNPEAFDAYLQGNSFLARNEQLAEKNYDLATRLEPTYPMAWLGLARARYRMTDAGHLPPEEGWRLAREADEQALALDPNLPDANAFMGEFKENIDFDWTGGDAYIQRAVALDPGNPNVVSSAARSAALLGRFDEALKLARRSLELDPLGGRGWVRLAGIELWAGALDEAEADIKKALERDPGAGAAHDYLADIYVLQGRNQEALAEIPQERIPEYRLQHYAIAYYSLGRQKEADAALTELVTKYRDHTAFQIAQVYALRNQPKEALDWLDLAYAQHDGGLADTKVDPFLAPLRNDPRFTAFLKKLNLPT